MLFQLCYFKIIVSGDLRVATSIIVSHQNYNKMSIEDQVSKREFSIKEVCDLLSAITCVNMDGAPENWVTTPEHIISNFCVEHSDEVLKDLCEHIEILGITRIAEHILCNKESLL